MTNPFDIKAAAAVLADHLAASGKPIANELLETGLRKILPALQSGLADRETQGLDWLTQFAAGNRLKGTATVGGTVISFMIESELKENQSA